MNLTSGTAIKTFSLLSIGHRGVGKTVFLAGSYAELYANQTERSLWFDCLDNEAQDNLEALFRYIARSGQYPPVTIKVTDFNFRLKQRNSQGIQTLCHFRWWDIPGEICSVHNADFTRIVSTSNGCCVFIDAHALVHQPEYQQSLTEIFRAVVAIADLVNLNGLKYAFAIILTKCDLLEFDPLTQQQLEVGLQPLLQRLDDVNANYQKFHSAIPIAHKTGKHYLNATGAAEPLLWLVQELNKIYHFGIDRRILSRVTQLRPQKANQPDVAPGLAQSLRSVSSESVTQRRRFYLTGALVAVGAIALFVLFGTDILLTKEQGSTQLLSEADSRSEFENEFRLQLAQSYKTAGQLDEAEALYDEVLAEQQNNLNALVNKAVLRYLRGDSEMARSLFSQAERVAPDNLKPQIRGLGQRVLQGDSNAIEQGGLGL
ncbi:MAG: tetratricopeptide repeat protein [Cyanophyceae cyanobacterium]